MHSYNYNIPQNYQNMYPYNGERFIPGGFIAPLLLGGVAGYAIGTNNNNNNKMNYYYPIYPNYQYQVYPYYKYPYY